jgi:ATP-dependent protease ClpP protease subunit
MHAEKLLELANRAKSLVKPPEARSGDWFRVVNANGERAELYIYGVIGDDWNPEDVTASQFVNALKEITASSIDLHINSPGGLVFDGVAIYSALKNHSATVNVSVDGIAASAASFVAMAGDSIAIEKPAKMMIHDARGLVIGNSDDMTEMASLLNELSDTIAEIYSDRAGGSVESWRAKMKAETWFSSAEAVKSGLADRVANDKASAPESRSSQLVRARARVRFQKGK